MAKRQRIQKRRQTAAQAQQRQTNWPVIGGIIAGGVLILAGLFWLAWGGSSTATTSLANYCAENEGRCISIGEADAPVTLVEVSDYGCGYCKNFNLQTAPRIEAEYVETGQVRWVVLPYALSAQTAPAAAASLCAADQDAFALFHHTMFEIQESELALTRDGFLSAATDLGLDIDTFTACVDGNQHMATIQANQQAATRAGVTGTPAFFVNDRPLEGARPFEHFQQSFARWLN